MEYKENLEKFRETLIESIEYLNTMTFVLDGGAWTGDKPVSNVLDLYLSVTDNIKKAFAELRETSGSIVIKENEDAKDLKILR
jgi:hypothetical protein